MIVDFLWVPGILHFGGLNLSLDDFFREKESRDPRDCLFLQFPVIRLLEHTEPAEKPERGELYYMRICIVDLLHWYYYAQSVGVSFQNSYPSTTGIKR